MKEKRKESERKKGDKRVTEEDMIEEKKMKGKQNSIIGKRRQRGR